MDVMVQNGAVCGVRLDGIRPETCEHCVKSKTATNTILLKTEAKRNYTSEKLIHSDVVGPVSKQSFGGKRYVVFLH